MLNVPSKQNWVRAGECVRKSYFCKKIQSGICVYKKDHDSNGRLHRHFGAYCLSVGKQLGHAEKDCTNKKTWGCQSLGLDSHKML